MDLCSKILSIEHTRKLNSGNFWHIFCLILIKVIFYIEFVSTYVLAFDFSSDPMILWILYVVNGNPTRHHIHSIHSALKTISKHYVYIQILDILSYRKLRVTEYISNIKRGKYTKIKCVWGLENVDFFNHLFRITLRSVDFSSVITEKIFFTDFLQKCCVFSTRFD